jgi:hypothetical protein
MQNSIELLPGFKDLPSDVQKVVSDFKYDEALKAIHAKNNLHIDQAAALEKEVARVIFGDARSHELMANIQKELRLNPEKAQEITLEVNNIILKPLQSAMKAMQTEE